MSKIMRYPIGYLFRTDNDQKIALVSTIYDLYRGNNSPYAGQKSAAIMQFHFVDPVTKMRYYDDTRQLGSGDLKIIRFRLSQRDSLRILEDLLWCDLKITQGIVNGWGYWEKDWYK
jgi:hypothetical protein